MDMRISFLQFVQQTMTTREGVTVKLKAEDQMAWVQRMNNIWERTTEIVKHDLIYI